MKRHLNLTFGFVLGLTLFGAIDGSAQTCRRDYPDNLCLRSCWNARNPSCSATEMGGLDRAVIHHTASNSDYNTGGLSESKTKVRGVQNYHMDVNGWCDIGYHFLVDKHGNMFSGRSNAVDNKPRGAHDGCNANSFGFTALGYFHPPYDNTPTGSLIDALEKLIAWRMPNGWDPRGSGSGYCNGVTDKIVGHRQVFATACPGDRLHNQTKDGSGFQNDIVNRRSCP